MNNISEETFFCGKQHQQYLCTNKIWVFSNIAFFPSEYCLDDRAKDHWAQILTFGVKLTS